MYQPGSSWELRAVPTEQGSRVEMIWLRNFKPTARGRIFGTLFRLAGKPIFTQQGRRILSNLQALETLTP